jgi:hypothetical protein
MNDKWRVVAKRIQGSELTLVPTLRRGNGRARRTVCAYYSFPVYSFPRSGVGTVGHGTRCVPATLSTTYFPDLYVGAAV